MQEDENLEQIEEAVEPSKKERAAEAGKDIAEVAAKGAGTYFGGPVGGKIADTLLNTRIGQKLSHTAGRTLARNPFTRHALSKAEPAIKRAKPLANAALGQLGGTANRGAGALDSTSKTPSNTPGDSSSNENGEGSTKPSPLNITSRNNDSKDKNKGSISSKLKKKLPLGTKLAIIGVIVLFFIIIIIAVLASGGPNLFLDYSGGVEDTSDIEAEYEEYWNEFCNEEEDGCNEEQKAAAEELKNSQTKFYDKFEKLSNKYLSRSSSIKELQQYMVLTTVFYGYDIDDFTEGNLAYQLDEDEEINYDTSAVGDIYAQEQDSIKQLIKHFKAYTPSCKIKQEDGNIISESIKNEENEVYILNFFDELRYKFGFMPDDYFAAQKQFCESRGGSVGFDETKDSQTSIDVFYKYLKESNYFDKKEHLREYYSDYGIAHNIGTDISTWADEDLIAVREDIIEDIKYIVEDYMDEHEEEFMVNEGTEYWWPTGAVAEEGPDGKLYSNDIPPDYLITHSNSFGPARMHPILGYVRPHEGSDLPGRGNETYVIASLGGTVVNVYTGCVSGGACPNGYGNHIDIEDSKGNVTRYAHLHQDTILVEVGETVNQGQVIAKVGSSGLSTGPHLHFEVRTNGVAMNPFDYIDPDDPRPQPKTSGDKLTDLVDFQKSSLTKSEFVSRLQSYFSNYSCSGKGSGCISFKNEVAGNGAATIYDVASKAGRNPELVVARSIREGFSPGTGYNYFGYGTYNVNANSAIFSSFKASMEAFYEYAGKYDNLYDMMYTYAYIGKYWYTNIGAKSWGLGGCIFKDLIYPDGAPERVEQACSVPCYSDGGGSCVETLTEDQDAYANYQVKIMDETINAVFYR